MMMEGAILAGCGRSVTSPSASKRQRVADALNFNQTMLRASPMGIVVFKAAGPCIFPPTKHRANHRGSREEVLKQNFRQLESWKPSRHAGRR